MRTNSEGEAAIYDTLGVPWPYFLTRRDAELALDHILEDKVN